MKPGNRRLRYGANSYRINILEDEREKHILPSIKEGFFISFFRLQR
jgi:hypothetical protein